MQLGWNSAVWVNSLHTLPKSFKISISEWGGEELLAIKISVKSPGHHIRAYNRNISTVLFCSEDQN